jgi:hypothetical protein
MRGKAVTANIEVAYNGFPPEAQTAFQRAVDIWETHIQSDVTIKVQASYATQEGENVLASAGPARLWFVTTDDGVESIYPDALVDALIGGNAVEEDEDPSNDNEPDIIAQFSDAVNWYFGLPSPEGPGPDPGQVDFTTVVLHELGHGLGFLGSMNVDGNVVPSQGIWGFGTSNPAVPAIYDRFAETSDGTTLIDTTQFPNPSPELADVLRSGDVFFSGTEADIGAAVEASGPIPPKLYLPAQWDEGSSYSHLDEAAYPFGDANSLMTPRIGGNEVIYQPGPVTCGMFADMGWRLGPSCAAYFDVAVVGFEVNEMSNRQYELTWAETRAADIGEYRVEIQYFDEPPFTQTIPSEGAQRYTIALEDLLESDLLGPDGRPEVGNYTVALSYVPDMGTDPIDVDEVAFTVPLRRPFELAEIYPNPFSERAYIKLTVRSAQNFRVEVYNALGQYVGALFDQPRPANDPRPIAIDVSQLGTLASGRYFFRVIGRNFEETRSAVYVR